jgi:glycosyltransferase involved in cell wall biosynthesis
MWFRGTNYLNSFLKRFFFNITNNSTSFVNSKYTYNLYNLKKYNIIHNGVSDEFLYLYHSDFYDRFCIPKGSKIIGFIGGWCDCKNHITLIRAFNLIAEKYKDVYLVCIGEHTKLTQEGLKEVNYKNRVRFEDKMIYASRYLRYFDVYVQPSYKEGFGNAVVEAMLAGCPIVAARAGALPELIKDGINGILYSPPNYSINCFHAIEMLLNNKTLAKKFSDKGKKMAHKYYSPEVFAKNFIGGLISLNQK